MELKHIKCYYNKRKMIIVIRRTEKNVRQVQTYRTGLAENNKKKHKVS